MIVRYFQCLEVCPALAFPPENAVAKIHLEPPMDSVYAAPPSPSPPQDSHVEAFIPVRCCLEVRLWRLESDNAGKALVMGSAP